MALLVDTSVWSLAYRRDTPPDVPEVEVLRRALGSGDSVVATGMILFELLRGFVPPKAQATILQAFESLQLIEPTRLDYVEAASVANRCRKAGVRLGSVDALLVQLALAGNHTLLTTDQDFYLAAPHTGLRVWRRPGSA